MVVEDFTWNLMELSSGVISKTGACAQLSDGIPTEARKPRVNTRVQCSVSFCHVMINFSRKSLTNWGLAWPRLCCRLTALPRFYSQSTIKDPIPLVGE